MPANGQRSTAAEPHYLLFAEAVPITGDEFGWRFALQPVGDGEPIAAEDAEPDADPSRLALLAVVRGLEALDAPSRVTLLCGSRYVRRGIRYDLTEWREQNWQWERFDQVVPIRDLDLWQRVDRALAIHRVECCWGLWSTDHAPWERATESVTAISGAEDRPARNETTDGTPFPPVPAWAESPLSRTA